MKSIIIYFSRADENYFGGQYRYVEVGNTEIVANMIQRATEADLFKIEPMTPYSSDYNTCIEEAKADLRAKARPEIESYPENLDEYDTIYLGYPNYWGTAPMHVFTLLEKYNWEGKKLHLFCTHEGSGMGHSEIDIKKACPGATIVDSLPLYGSSVKTMENVVKGWAK